MTARADDERLMDEALALATQGCGATSPNPLVGALIVSRVGTVVGRGYHERAGQPHAEAVALDDAGPAARGGTLYCTLEPCNHVGRTGPCTTRIIDAGVRRVVAAIVDPDPRVRGRGIARLRAAAIEVVVGVRRIEATRLNQAFITRVTKGRPFVSLKIAVSRDGKVAAAPGRRTRLTSPAANHMVHERRALVDAIGVGSGTVLVDDPRLTARGAPRARPLVRVVFDRRLRTPATARLFATLDSGPVLIVTGPEAMAVQPGHVDVLRKRGAQVEVVPDGTLGSGLRRVADLGVTTLVLEGGVTMHRTAWHARVVDHVQCIRTPVVLGPHAVSWIGDDVDLAGLSDRRETRYGPDVLVEGYVHRVD